MKRIEHKVPTLPSFETLWLPFAEAVAKTSYMPNPAVVRTVAGAVFPTTRNQKARRTAIEGENGVVGMYDDNTTPRWALLWAHGFGGISKNGSKGWTFAHVWPTKDDRDSYTNLANLAMIPECFGSLTDKDGPVTHYLRWHAWIIYGWKPPGKPVPAKPPEYDSLVWRYFDAIDNPVGFIAAQFEKGGCKRCEILRPLVRFSARGGRTAK